MFRGPKSLLGGRRGTTKKQHADYPNLPTATCRSGPGGKMMTMMMMMTIMTCRQGCKHMEGHRFEADASWLGPISTNSQLFWNIGSTNIGRIAGRISGGIYWRASLRKCVTSCVYQKRPCVSKAASHTGKMPNRFLAQTSKYSS